MKSLQLLQYPYLWVLCFLLWLAGSAQAQFFTDMSGTIDLGTSNIVAWGDYDNDGWDDLLAQGWHLYRNNQSGGFVDMTEPSGLGALPGGSYSGIWGDYDNDGWLDIFSTSGQAESDAPDYLLHNEGNGTFTWSDACSDFWCAAGGGWGDYNRDGAIDLYIATAEWWEHGGGKYRQDVFYENRGGGDFADVTADVGMGDMGAYYGRGVSWCDYDEDGDQDIYIPNYRLSPNFLWQNQGDGTFIDVGEALGVAGDPEMYGGQGPYYGHTIGAAWGDIDNDGHFDLVAANLAHGGYYLEFSDITKIYLNQGPPSWAFIDWPPESSGVVWVETHSSPALADFDHDGDLDMIITCVYQTPKARFYRNLGGGVFEDITNDCGIVAHNSWGAAWADYDHDGDMDVALHGGGILRLCRNDAAAGHWVKIQLTGQDSNRAAIGARVDIVSGGLTQTRAVEAGMGTCASQNSFTLHFGLNTATTIDALTIRWPSGLVDSYSDLPVDTTHQFLEDGGVARGSLNVLAIDSGTQQPIHDSRARITPVSATTTAYLRAPDATGWLRFTNAISGQYELQLSAPGYEAASHTLTIEPGETAEAQFDLDPLAAMTGTYVIAPETGDFTSLDAAFRQLQTVGITGPVTLEIAPGYYSEPSLTIGNILGVDETSRITVKPAAGGDVTLAFALNARHMGGLILDGADYLIFDGDPGDGGRHLTLTLDQAPQSEAYTIVTVHSWRTVGNTFQNCNLQSFSADVLNAGVVKDNGLGTQLLNNRIGRCYLGVLADMQSHDLRLIGNDFGGGDLVDKITFCAFQLGGYDTVADSNLIHNIRHMEGKSRLEVISLLWDKRTLLANNALFAITNTAGSGIKAGTYAILVTGSTDSRILHNSVYLQGNDGGINSWCMFVTGDSGAVTVKNNCFYNIKEGNRTDIGVELEAGSVISLAEDHNFFYGADRSTAGFISHPTTVISGDPKFTSADDLHIGETSVCQGLGVLLADVPLDFDGEARENPCDAGADEDFQGSHTATPAATHTPTPQPSITPTSPPGTPTHTHTPTMTPTATINPTHQPTPEPSATPRCEQTGVELYMPASYFTPGMECSLSAIICANEGPLSSIPFFVLLDVGGSYWCAPSWRSLDEGLDGYVIDVPAGSSDRSIIPPFIWPEGAGAITNIYFYAAMTDPHVTSLVGQFGAWQFGFGE